MLPYWFNHSTTFHYIILLLQNLWLLEPTRFLIPGALSNSLGWFSPPVGSSQAQSPALCQEGFKQRWPNTTGLSINSQWSLGWPWPPALITVLIFWSLNLLLFISAMVSGHWVCGLFPWTQFLLAESLLAFTFQGLSAFLGLCLGAGVLLMVPVMGSRWLCWKFNFNWKKAVQHHGVFRSKYSLVTGFHCIGDPDTTESDFTTAMHLLHYCPSLWIFCVLQSCFILLCFICITSSANYVYYKLFVVSKSYNSLNIQQNKLKKNKCLTTGFKRFIKCHLYRKKHISMCPPKKKIWTKVSTDFVSKQRKLYFA